VNPRSILGLDEALEFSSAVGWERWLSKNHSKPNGVWLRIFKKASAIPSITISEALDLALCYGWITGQAKPGDEKSWLSRFVPRRPRSIWSKINVQHAKRLIREGRMKPAGLKQIEQAKKDGRWDRAYSPPSTARLPQDFRRGLRRNRKAAAFFKTLNKANIYSVVFRLETASSRESRKAKIRQIIKMLEREETFH
jgi:uncharacterized protein YdeI (YjbR/CyaY-like superfamily)